MSCLPGTPCYTSTINTTGGIPGGCNLDPCNTNRLGTDSVFYIGPTLPCSGINPCDNVSLALQKIDAIICNPPSLSVTANNGLTKTANNIQLGGPLVQQTVITTSFANTLSLLGLANDSNPAFVLSQTNAGVIRKTAITSILSGISANNGLTITAGLIQLSGPLIKPTTVTTDVTNTLTLAGLQTDAAPDFIVTETTAGVVRRIATSALSTIITTSVTANNGLTKTGNNIQLGGALILPNTTIVTNATTNTLSITGLSTDATPDFILTETTAGIVKKIATTDLESSITNLITVDNGLTKTANNIQLGGTLIKSTAVNLEDFALVFQNKLIASPVNSEFTFTKSAASLDTYDNIITTPAGSRSRVISFKSSTAMWTTNYLYNGLPNPAYNAFTYWLTNVKNWIPAEYPSGYPAGVSFQILENMLGSNNGSALHAHYFDERINKPQWKDTWEDTTTPNKYSSVFPGWILGKTYTIRDFVIGDDFTGAYNPGDGVRSGTLNTTGFTFISNGVAPANWTNGSLVDGDFPITDLDIRTAYISTTEGDDPSDPFYQQGIVRVQANATFIDGYVDQGSSSRGLRLSVINVGDPLPTTAVIGEMFYRVDDDSIVFKIDNLPTWKKVNTTTTT
jgi:hypothetical protein